MAAERGAAKRGAVENPPSRVGWRGSGRISPIIAARLPTTTLHRHSAPVVRNERRHGIPGRAVHGERAAAVHRSRRPRPPTLDGGGRGPDMPTSRGNRRTPDSPASLDASVGGRSHRVRQKIRLTDRRRQRTWSIEADRVSTFFSNPGPLTPPSHSLSYTPVTLIDNSKHFSFKVPTMVINHSSNETRVDDVVYL